jgi:magnesium-transporting ATPase (P-type)
MGTDSLTALGLGTERPTEQMMQRPPRSQGRRLLDCPLALRAYLFLGAIEAGAAMSAFFVVLARGGWVYGQRLAVDDALYRQATTACFTAIIVMQVINVFLCRSATRSISATGLFGNPLILWGVGMEILLAIVIDYTHLGNVMLRTAPISGSVWLFILPLGVALLVLEEARKWLARRTVRRWA